MLDLNVLHNQWLAMALMGGLVLMLSTILTYYALWRPRVGETHYAASRKVRGPMSFVKWWVSVVPWIITLTYLAIATYAIWYVLARIAHPPNW